MALALTKGVSEIFLLSSARILEKEDSFNKDRKTRRILTNEACCANQPSVNAIKDRLKPFKESVEVQPLNVYFTTEKNRP